MVFFCILKVKVIYDSFIYETRWWQGETDISIDITLFKRIKEWLRERKICPTICTTVCATSSQRQMSITSHQQVSQNGNACYPSHLASPRLANANANATSPVRPPRPCTYSSESTRTARCTAWSGVTRRARRW